MQCITSVRKAYVQHCVKLRTKKSYRDSCQRVLLVGNDVVQEILVGGERAVSVFLCEPEDKERPDKRVRRFKRADQVFYVSAPVMMKLTGLESVSAVEAVAEMAMPETVKEWKSKRVLALDGIQDPGNLGSLLRTCACFGWGPVLLLPGCCDAFNDKALKASKGASFKVPLIKIDHDGLPQLLKEQNLVSIAAVATEKGLDLDSTARELKESDAGVCLFLGSEGNGLSSSVQKLCKRVVRIPQSSRQESLNVAIAGGILMFQFSSYYSTNR